MEQHRLAVRCVEDAGLQAHGAAGRDAKRQVSHALVGEHVLHDAAGGAHDLDGLAGVVGLVQDAPASVAAFSCQIPVSFRVFVEFDA